MESVRMKQMVILSIGVHFFFFTCLLMLHYLKWEHPKIKPRVLSVQLLTLPQPRAEEKKPLPAEPLKRTEAVPPAAVEKKPAPKARPVIKPVLKPAPVIPRLPVHPEPPSSVPIPEPKTEEPVRPPVVEDKKEQIIPPAEPQKVEIAQISAIDPDYTERVKRKIENNWNPAPFTGNPKEVTLSFVILKSGLVKMPLVIKSSGDAYFDNAARRAVLESRSFGPLPPDYPNFSVEITCSFSQNKGS